MSRIIASHRPATTVDPQAIDRALKEGRRLQSRALRSFLTGGFRGLFGRRIDRGARSEQVHGHCTASA